MRLLNRKTAETIIQALSAPEFSHWVRQLEIREQTTGEIFVTTYVEYLTPLRIDDLNRVLQNFEVTWRADPSRTADAIFIRITDRT